MERPVVRLRCSDGQRGEDARVFAVVAAGHGAVSSSLAMTASGVRGEYVDRPFEREVGAPERDALFARLERPPPTNVKRAEIVLTTTFTCDGSLREEAIEATVGAQHHSFSTWLQAPFQLERLTSAVTGSLRDLDPRPRRIAATAYELLSIAEAMSGE